MRCLSAVLALATLLGSSAFFVPLQQCRLVTRGGALKATTNDKGVERRDVFSIASAAAIMIGLNPAVNAAGGIDYATVRADINSLIDKDKNKGPTLLRLAWHSSGTYDKMQKDGGSSGGTIRFDEELAHGANAGLKQAVAWMEPIAKKHKISHADLYTFGGVVAIANAGGPAVGWRAGRVDALDPKTTVTADGRLPAADKGSPQATAQGLRDVFGRMGFNDQEIVALAGAHALGRCHAENSGYVGPWTPTPTTFNNAYFTLLENVKWTPKKWDGPAQFEDPSGTLMMLPSDIVLTTDKEFAKYVTTYAKSNDAFNSDFAAAFQKLEELGCTGLRDV